jgi:cell division inhibitor SulA
MAECVLTCSSILPCPYTILLLLLLLLLQDAQFRNYTAARWQQLRAPGGNLTNEWFSGQIAGLKQLLQEPAARNYQKYVHAAAVAKATTLAH